MLQVFSSLIPRFEPNETILQDEFDEVNELLFINEGRVGIGYTMNQEKKFVVFRDCNSVIGTQGIMLNKRSEFIYKAFSDVHGFALPKRRWSQIVLDNPRVIE